MKVYGFFSTNMYQNFRIKLFTVAYTTDTGWRQVLWPDKVTDTVLRQYHLLNVLSRVQQIQLVIG